MCSRFVSTIWRAPRNAIFVFHRVADHDEGRFVGFAVWRDVLGPIVGYRETVSFNDTTPTTSLMQQSWSDLGVNCRAGEFCGIRSQRPIRCRSWRKKAGLVTRVFGLP